MAKAEKKEEAKETKETKKEDEVQSTGKKRKLIIFGGIGALVLASAAASAFFFFSGSKKHAAQEDLHAKKDSATAVQAPDPKAKGATPDPHAQADAKGTADSHKPADAPVDPKKSGHGTADTSVPGDKKNEHASGGGDSKAKGGEHGTPSGKGSEDKPTDGKKNLGEMYPFPRFDLNLGNPLENRFLRLGITVEYRGGKDQFEELKQREPLVKDLVISAVSNRTRADLSTEQGRNKLRRDILNRINEVSDKPVQAVYFTEFIVE